MILARRSPARPNTVFSVSGKAERFTVSPVIAPKPIRLVPLILAIRAYYFPRREPLREGVSACLERARARARILPGVPDSLGTSTRDERAGR